MSEEIVLNRREGVVAAQDVHLNRSVYSEPYPHDINDTLVGAKEGSISSGYIERLHPEVTATDHIKGNRVISVETKLTEVYRFLEYATRQSLAGRRKLTVTPELTEVYNNNEIGEVKSSLCGKRVLYGPTFLLEQIISEVEHTSKDTLKKSNIKTGVVIP